MKENVFNILDALIFEHAINDCRNKTAVIASGKVLTYGALSNYVRVFSNQVEAWKYANEGEVVACLFDDSVDSVVCFFGLIYNGRVPCYLSPSMPIDAYDFYLNSVQTKYVLLSAAYESKFSKLLNGLGIRFEVVKDNFFLNGNKSGDSQGKTFTEHSPLFCAYTSGTTGYPGAVMHRHKDVKLMNELYARHILYVNEHDVLFTTSKMYFAYGLNSLFIALYHGATAILPGGEITEETIFSIFEHNNPTIFFSVPRIYRKLLNYEESKKISIPSKCISAGENLCEDIFKKWEKKYSKALIDGIGSTETLSTFISNMPERAKAGCTGKVVQGFECELRDIAGHSVEIGQQGILWVKGPTFDKEYMNNSQSTKERFMDGWFKTNDIFFKDDTHDFYYVGRVNELIYKNGIWVFPSKIESKVNKLTGIAESMIVGHKSNDGDILVIALIEPENKANLCEVARNVIQACSKGVFYQEEEVNAVIFVDKLMKTFNGKIKRNGALEEIDRTFLSLLENSNPITAVFDNRTREIISVKSR